MQESFLLESTEFKQKWKQENEKKKKKRQKHKQIYVDKRDFPCQAGKQKDKDNSYQPVCVCEEQIMRWHVSVVLTLINCINSVNSFQFFDQHAVCQKKRPRNAAVSHSRHALGGFFKLLPKRQKEIQMSITGQVRKLGAFSLIGIRFSF